MKSKSPVLTIFNLLLVFGFFCWFINPIIAAEYQNCSVSADCSIGEFLYDDSYVPITTATCSITSRYPDNSIFINSATMSAETNGWYSYTATIGTTEGIYPTQICCTAASDYLCLDKTFKVTTTSSGGSSGATAAEIWSYPTRTVTSFGTLVADIWDYSSRSLSNFGTLVADIWSKDTRTLTSSDTASSLVTSADIKEIKRVVKDNRILLEQLINKPIVKTFIDEVAPPKLTDKLDQTKTAAADLYSGVQNLKSRSLLLYEKWPQLNINEVKSELATLLYILKQDNNRKDSNILATTSWLKTSWNSPILLNLSDQARASEAQISNLINDINLYGIDTRNNSFATAYSHIIKLDTLVGTSLATSSDLSLYGFIKNTSDTIALYDKQTSEGLRILTEIKKEPSVSQSTAISELQNNILSTNKVPQVDTFFVSSLKKSSTPTNKVLSLLAVIDSNKLLLAGNTGQTIKTIWLEEGSIVFRSVAINPSSSISQKVTVKYYLPSELKKEQIINHDPELTIEYDPIENALFAVSEVTLSPLETRTFLVEVEDIWSFQQEEIDSLKNQVNELTSLLKNSSSFAQATTIKSDIVVTLDKIMLRQGQAITPENRIQTYRESSLEMNGVEDKITSLKELVLQANTQGSLFGFAGGIQPITLWGIILVAIAGFAFLTIYFNAIRHDSKMKAQLQKEIVTDALEEHDSIYHPTPKYRHRENTHNHRGHRIAKIASIVLLVSGFSSIGAASAIKATKGNTITLISPTTTTSVLGTTDSTTLSFPYKSKIKMSDSGKVPVRSAPSISSPEIMSLKDVDKIYVFKIIDGWAQIGLSDKDADKGWWLNAQYLVQK